MITNINFDVFWKVILEENIGKLDSDKSPHKQESSSKNLKIHAVNQIIDLTSNAKSEFIGVKIKELFDICLESLKS